jgi:hypothetical protein
MLRLSCVALLAAGMLAVAGGLNTAMAAPPVDCAKQDAQTGICLVEATSAGQDADAEPVAGGVNPGAGQSTSGDASPRTRARTRWRSRSRHRRVPCGRDSLRPTERCT